MANHKSAKKRIDISARQNMENRIVRNGLRSQLKKLDAAINDSNENLAEIFKTTIGAIDKAASKGVIHKNAANRKKAQAAKKMAVL